MRDAALSVRCDIVVAVVVAVVVVVVVGGGGVVVVVVVVSICIVLLSLSLSLSLSPSLSLVWGVCSREALGVFGKWFRGPGVGGYRCEWCVSV